MKKYICAFFVLFSTLATAGGLPGSFQKLLQLTPFDENSVEGKLVPGGYFVTHPAPKDDSLPSHKKTSAALTEESAK